MRDQGSINQSRVADAPEKISAKNIDKVPIRRKEINRAFNVDSF
jgi:hypothetical protein